MKVKRISIAGFRGFNDERTVEFNPKLTLIYGPNSYGKTSISEAFEWLVYGATSKVENAPYKEEFRDSYRNRHLDDNVSSTVSMTAFSDEGTVEYRAELDSTGLVRRLVNGGVVEGWPFFEQGLDEIPRPFILQHALKDLLLAKPDQRFQRFARILGLDVLDEIQRHVVSLCTKPDPHIPGNVQQLLRQVHVLEERLTERSSLVSISRAYKRGKGDISRTYAAVRAASMRYLPSDTPDDSVLPRLLRVREEAAEKVFNGRLTLTDYSEAEARANSEDQALFLNAVSPVFIEGFTSLVLPPELESISQRESFVGSGLALMQDAPDICPFCGQHVAQPVVERILTEQASLATKRAQGSAMEKAQALLAKDLQSLEERLVTHHNRLISKSAALLGLEPALGDVKRILGEKNETHFASAGKAVSALKHAKTGLDTSYASVLKVIGEVKQSLKEVERGSDTVTLLKELLASYVAASRVYGHCLSEWTPGISDADAVLRREIDALAGTEDVGVLIELLEQRSSIEKCVQVSAVLASLTDLRNAVDQYVAARVCKAVTGELTADVMEWYDKIKTAGDPDVHFGGFDVDRTKEGKLRARRVQIKAASYGKELASAVSSLSESKLNALGLCMGIAANVNSPSPFGFILIDDPIQSLDAQHETRFCEVVLTLVERGKQVILLSHNRPWLDIVAAVCRSVNGTFYEIISYTKAGPQIAELHWAKWHDRLDTVDAILKDASATSVVLGQAEEEIRIAIGQIAAEGYLRKTGKHKSWNNMNAREAKKTLLECGVRPGLVDRICQTFQTTDEAHHGAEGYSPEKQRIGLYHSWAHELVRELEL